MKQRICLLLSISLLLGLAACGSAPAQPEATEAATAPVTEAAEMPTEAPEVPDEENLIPGGSFDEANGYWNLYTESEGVGSFAVSDGKLHVTVDNTGFVDHAVQVYCDGFEVLEGARYEMSFDICSTVERTIEWRIQVNGGDYHAYAGTQHLPVTTEMQSFAFEFIMEEASDPAPRFCLNMGDADRSQELDAHEIILEHVTLKLLDDSNAVAVKNISGKVDINLNQVGYRPGDSKTAIFRNASADKSFEVVDQASGDVVYTGEVLGSTAVGGAAETVAYADFSELTAPGTYILRAENSGESYPFTVAEDVYDGLLKDTVRMLYLQRCGMTLDESLAGDFAHPACHLETATVYGGTETIEVSGGWHDAGDYGRYPVPGAKAAADLLLAYELNPDVFTDDFEIPESGNGIPDVLDEARYELEWLMKVQTPDGGVYHKITGLNFDGTVMPEDCTAQLFALPVSLTATGDCAAVWYMAARIYAPFDAAFAQKCLDCAGLALSWYEANNNGQGFRNPADVLTGEYPDENVNDEYYWAICEGFKTTGSQELADKISAFDLSAITEDGLGWIAMTEYGLYALLSSPHDNTPDTAAARARLDRVVSELSGIIRADSYHSSIENVYPWGSNMSIANNGMLLLMNNALQGSEERGLAASQLDYLLGANTTSYCFVSGYGTLSPQHPHHRPSQSLGVAMKGMLAGGPNSGREDPYASQVLKNASNAGSYVDNEQSYSTNEITIYWNSPLICLIAGLMGSSASATGAV